MAEASQVPDLLLCHVAAFVHLKVALKSAAAMTAAASASSEVVCGDLVVFGVVIV